MEDVKKAPLLGSYALKGHNTARRAPRYLECKRSAQVKGKLGNDCVAFQRWNRPLWIGLTIREMGISASQV